MRESRAGRAGEEGGGYRRGRGRQGGGVTVIGRARPITVAVNRGPLLLAAGREPGGGWGGAQLGAQLGAGWGPVGAGAQYQVTPLLIEERLSYFRSESIDDFTAMEKV